MDEDEVKVEDLPGGGYIATGSTEALFAFEAANRAAAIEAMTDSQRSISMGGYACYVEMLLYRTGPPIFGALWSVAELTAWHELYYGVAEDPEAATAVLMERGCFPPPSETHEASEKIWEGDGFASAEDAIEYYRGHTIANHADGYLSGRWFSVDETRDGGELGDKHASMCVPITEEFYRDALANGGLFHEVFAGELTGALAVIREELAAREAALEGEGDDDSGS